MNTIPAINAGTTEPSLHQTGFMEGKTRIGLVDPCLQKDWDSLVMSHPGSSFFHGAAWARVLRDSYGFSPRYVVATRDNQLLGLLPIMEARSPITGSRGVSLPFTDECAALTSNEIDRATLSEVALEQGRTRNWKYWEYRSGDKLSEAELESVSFHGHHLSLHGTVKRLFDQLESSVRRAIRKGERSGVKVELVRKFEAVMSFFTLHCRTRKKHGLPPQPYSFFQNIYEQIVEKGQGFIALARQDGVPVAAGVYFHLGTKAVYKFGASDERFQNVRGSNLVMWEAIKWLAENGFTELNFGRTSLANEGLRKFKLGWGSEEYRLSYSKYDFRKRAFVREIDRAAGWHNRFFALMPIPLSRWAGAFLYKHIA